MSRSTVKETPRRLIEQLPDEATWGGVDYEIYVWRAIESGLADSDAGKVESVAEVRRFFGLPDDQLD